MLQLSDERRIAARGEIRRGQLLHRRHQCLGNEPAAEFAEVAARVGIAQAEGWADGRVGGWVNVVHEFLNAGVVFDTRG